LEKSLAIGAALSLPVWLEKHENFAISGGVGYSHGGASAFGFNGAMRFDKNVSGFAGIASDGNTWAGKAGMRIGW
jgi:hypothetical protein